MGGYKGNAGNSLGVQNGMKFTTTDQDNDLGGGNCANIGGPGWHKSCCHACPLNNLLDRIWYTFTGTRDTKNTKWMVK